MQPAERAESYQETGLSALLASRGRPRPVARWVRGLVVPLLLLALWQALAAGGALPLFLPSPLVIAR
ncbi:MAG TPA: hypothetical protein VNM50_10930, partial [Chloroflexota bacterium]|nr:hypothetical protein [Chloroflexota bacterium]